MIRNNRKAMLYRLTNMELGCIITAQKTERELLNGLYEPWVRNSYVVNHRRM